MRVALVAHAIGPTGGQDRYVLELAARLGARCQVDIIGMRVQGVPPGTARIRPVGPWMRPMLLRAPWFRRRAGAAVSSGQYDVVHTIGGALPGASVITAQFCHAAWGEASPPKTWYQRAVLAQAVRDERRAYTHAGLRHVIAVSHRTATEIERYYGPLKVPVTVIPNGVDGSRFKPHADARPQPGRPRLLFVGAYERKGLDTAIRALSLMKRDAELRAVGEGARGSFASLAAALGVGDRVTLEPARNHIEEVFASADAFVFPTRYEPFGIVIVEAMASGLAVVTSAVAGAAELIRDGVSGRVMTDAEDAAAFAAALDDVLADERRRAAMGSSARDAVRTLDWDVITERTLDVYRAVLPAA